MFWVNPMGAASNRNFLWFEEADLGLDAGAWTLPLPPPLPASLAALPDELDALDSTDPATICSGRVQVYGTGCPGSGGFTPFATVAGCPQW